MKRKLLSLIVTILVCISTVCASPFERYTLAGGLPNSYPFTLTETTNVTTIAGVSGSYTGTGSGDAVAVQLVLDGTVELTQVFGNPASGGGNMVRTVGYSGSILYGFDNLPAGEHIVSFRVAVVGNTNYTSTSPSGSILFIKENELAGVTQEDLDTIVQQITADYQTADDTLRASLETQLAAIQTALLNQINSLDNRVTNLEAQITALLMSQGNQDAQMEALQAQLAAFQSQVNYLTGLNSSLAERVSTLEAQGTRGGSSEGISQRKELQTSDYLIIGGSAAGATALGIGIYSILDDSFAESGEELVTDNQPSTHGWE